MNDELVKMWNRVKGDNLSTKMILIIAVFGICILGFVIYNVANKRKQKQMQNKRRQRR